MYRVEDIASKDAAFKLSGKCLLRPQLAIPDRKRTYRSVGLSNICVFTTENGEPCHCV